MSEKQSLPVKVRVIKAEERQLEKAESPVQINEHEAYSGSEWIMPLVDMRAFKNMVKESSILPQCIRAYKNNIAGFGIGVRYIDDQEETPEMAEEYERATQIIDLLCLDKMTKEVFEDIIEARETYGIAYIEVIRNLAGEVVQIEFIKSTPSIIKTEPLQPYVDMTYYYRGEEITRKKKFCKYRQQIGGKTVYFKEFGDPRIMDNRSGEYLEDGRALNKMYQANEILEFAIGTEPYGEVRWIGQVLGIDGSRRAETLNNNYFVNGRHTPLMIIVNNGTVKDESYDRLQAYMNDIKGENGQHAFILLEVESTEEGTDFETEKKPDIEIKDLASILQKDELFQEYLDNNRRRAQSSFLLPDLYVGYTTDFNRATAQTAMEVTEKQVFQPERKSLAWKINNKLLNCYRFRHVEIFFLEPDITNPDDLYKIMTAANNAGGLTPNKAKGILFDMLGETFEEYPDDWGNVPVAILKNQSQSAPTQETMTQLTEQIEKAQSRNESEEIVSVMKEVRRILEDIQKQEAV